MASKEDPDYEPTTFRKKELSSRNSKLSAIIVFSIVAVFSGIANVILFSNITNERKNPTCEFLKIEKEQDISVVLVWASSGIFAVFVIIIASIAKSTKNAWSGQITAFIILAPFVIILCLAIFGASGLLGACHTQYYVLQNKGQPIQDVVANHPKIFYGLIDLLVLIMSFIVFFLMLTIWIQTLNKRSKSKETKEREKKEKLTKDENKNQTSSLITTTTTTTTPQADKSNSENAPKAVPNVYFIQVPNQPNSSPPDNHDQVSPYSQYGNSPYSPYGNSPYSPYGNSPYSPYGGSPYGNSPYSPYGMPQYRPIQPPPPPMPQPRRRPPWLQPARGRRHAVYANRGHSMFPY